MGGLILCQALASTPFVFLLLSATFRAMDPALEEASAASGASPWTTFRRVTLPVLLPGLLAPVVLITLITAEQFELPLIIGLPAQINVFSYRIYFELNPLSSLPNYGGAAALSLPFVMLGVLLLALYNRLIRRADNFVTVRGRSYRPRRLPLGSWRLPALAAVGLYGALAALLPAAVLLWTSVFGYTPPLSASAADFSLEAYRALLTSRTFWLGLRNTLLVAGLSALVVTAIGMLLGWIISRSQFRFRRALDFVSVLSVGIPAVIAGLGVMLLYLSLPIGLYGTVGILVVAYCYRFATTTRLARAGFLQIHRELEEASAVSGARWLTTQWRILLPLMLPTLAAGFILLFIVGVREFTIPLVLYSPDNVVLSVLLWQMFQSGQPALSAALASIIVAIVLPLIFLSRSWLARRVVAQ
jgi:iron(III) transport system permease protein